MSQQIFKIQVSPFGRAYPVSVFVSQEGSYVKDINTENIIVFQPSTSIQFVLDTFSFSHVNIVNPINAYVELQDYDIINNMPVGDTFVPTYTVYLGDTYTTYTHYVLVSISDFQKPGTISIYVH